MTSKISFTDLMKESMKRSAAFGVLLLVGFFCYYPIGTLLMLGANGTSAYRAFDSAQISQVFGLFLIQNPLLFAVTGVSAVVLGFMQFWYLHSQEKLDLYHSIPVRREKLFGAQYVSGILLWVVPFAGNLLLAWIICLLNGIGLMLTPALLSGLAAHICCFLLAYGFTILAMMLTGKLFAALAGLMVFFGYIPALTVLKVGLLGYYFSAYTETAADEFWLYCTPLYLYYRVTEILMSGRFPLDYVLAALLLGVLVSVVCICLYRVRPSEKAGTSMVFPAVARVVKCLLVAPASLAFALIFYLLGGENPFWGFFGLIFGLLLVSAVIEFVYCMDIREVLRDRKQIFFTGVVTFVILCILQFDLFGYNKWLPDPEKLAAIRIESPYLMGDSMVDVYALTSGIDMPVNVPGSESAMPIYTQESETDAPEDSACYVRTDSRYTEMVCTQEQFDEMFDVIRQSNVFTGGEYAWGEMDVAYQMKDGSVKRRRYYYADPKEKIAPIWEREEQKLKMYPVLSIQPEDLFTVQTALYYSDFYYVSANEENTLTKEQKEKLLETFQSELRAASYREFLEYSNDKINLVYRTASGELQGEDFYLNSAFAETRKLLEEYGFELMEI